MYYFPVNLVLVFFQGCGYYIIHHGLEQQRALVNFLAADFSQPWFCLSNPEDVARWALDVAVSWWESEGVLPMGAGGSFPTSKYVFRGQSVDSSPSLQLLLSKGRRLMRTMPLRLPRAFLRCDCSDPWHTHLPALPAVCGLQHSLWEDPARATACSATHSSKVMSPGTGTLL